MSVRGLLWSVGNQVRWVGDKLNKAADAFQLRPIGIMEKRCGHNKLINLGDRKPVVGQGVWIAPTASVIGSVSLAPNSTVWYGAVLRGDIHNIKIGSLSYIGDRSVIHVSSGKVNGQPRGTTIGAGVIVEPGAVLHACTVEDGCKIGSLSVVFDGAVIEKHTVLASGSVVTQGKRIPSRELWAGNPAKFVRKLEEEEIEQIQEDIGKFYSLANHHEQESTKAELQILAERELKAAREDIWWGFGVYKQGIARDHLAVKNLVDRSHEPTATKT